MSSKDRKKLTLKRLTNDEGEMQMRIRSDQGLVFLDFKGPVMSLGLTPPDALDLAMSLIKQAKEMIISIERAELRKKGETIQ